MESIPRSPSYRSESFTLSSNGAWRSETPRAGPSRSTSVNRSHSTDQFVRSSSHAVYLPAPSNSFVPPISGSPAAVRSTSCQRSVRNKSYPSHPSQMVASSSQANLIPSCMVVDESQLPSSMEQIRDAGVAMCARLFAPPPRKLSFEKQPQEGMALGAVAPAPAVVPPPPQRMLSRGPAGNAALLALPSPLRNDSANAIVAQKNQTSFQPLGKSPSRKDCLLLGRSPESFQTLGKSPSRKDCLLLGRSPERANVDEPALLFNYACMERIGTNPTLA